MTTTYAPIKEVGYAPLQYNLDGNFSVWDANQEQIEKINNTARAEGQLVGRVIRFNVGDGYARYFVTKVNARTATVVLITGMGDDYRNPAWGVKASVSLKTIKFMVSQQDRFDAMWR
jgi:hypothetical protein